MADPGEVAMMRQRACVLSRNIWLLLLLALLGCGHADNRASVSGEVRLNGKPIEQGSINFFPAGGVMGPSTGGSVVTGAYQVLGGVVIGKNRVEIQSAGKSGKKVKSLMNPKELMDEIVELVPPKYNKKSELIVDVQPGKNKFDFELKSK